MNEFTRPEVPGQFAFPIAKAGFALIFSAAFATLVLSLLKLTIPALIGLAATFGIAWFFRDPDRVIPARPGLVVSPADGKVIAVEMAKHSEFLDDECIKISIFMSIFNVHVNRIPAEGRIRSVSYRPGSFVAANRREASLRNEHNAVVLETGYGKRLCFVQIAGLIARRIICRLQPEETVRRGERFGMICFGSRLDVYLPDDFSVLVSLGDRVKAGTSVLGSFRDTTGL